MDNYLHKFDTTQEFNTAYNGSDYNQPWVSLTEDIDKVDYNKYKTNGYGYVDLELPSGTLWACCNIGAESPEEYGDYFAWGETKPKETYNWSTYKWGSSANNITKYTWTDDKYFLDPEDDAAHVNWGGWWTIPTKQQWLELKNNCTYTNVTINGVAGKKFYKSGNPDKYVFFPYAGNITENELENNGQNVTYWTLQKVGTHSSAQTVYIYNDSTLDVGNSREQSRYKGYCIRPVCLPSAIKAQYKLSNGDVTTIKMSTGWDETNGLYGNNNQTFQNRRRSFIISNGELGYNLTTDDITFTNSTEYYPIPIPENSTRLIVSVFPTTNYPIHIFGTGFYTYDGESYTRTWDSGWKTDGAYLYQFNAREYDYITVCTKYDNAGTTYPEEPQEVVITFY